MDRSTARSLLSTAGSNTTLKMLPTAQENRSGSEIQAPGAGRASRWGNQPNTVLPCTNMYRHVKRKWDSLCFADVLLHHFAPLRKRLISLRWCDNWQSVKKAPHSWFGTRPVSVIATKWWSVSTHTSQTVLFLNAVIFKHWRYFALADILTTSSDVSGSRTFPEHRHFPVGY